MYIGIQQIETILSVDHLIQLNLFLDLVNVISYEFARPPDCKDSDLTLFGCESILFKMDSVGNGVLYEKSKLGLCLGNKADAFDFSKVGPSIHYYYAQFLSTFHHLDQTSKVKS